MAIGNGLPASRARSNAKRPCLPMFIFTESVFLFWIITRYVPILILPVSGSLVITPQPVPI
jgi:hypothetical protein